MDYKDGTPLYPVKVNLGEWIDDGEEMSLKLEQVGPDLLAITHETDPSIEKIM